jgi:hypothetical protein
MELIVDNLTCKNKNDKTQIYSSKDSQEIYLLLLKYVNLILMSKEKNLNLEKSINKKMKSMLF